jgi:DnaJ like chaperone protein
LLEAATADGTLTAAEEVILQRACVVLHIPANVYAAMRRAREGGAQSHSGQYQQVPSRDGSLQQAYASLGLKTDASEQEIKRAYRKLISQYHPDKLVSQGLPEEMMEMSKRRVREINAAYDRIKASKGIK